MGSSSLHPVTCWQDAKRGRHAEGFSLLEMMMVVVTLILIVAPVAIPIYQTCGVGSLGSAHRAAPRTKRQLAAAPPKIRPRQSFPRKRESRSFWTDVDPRLRGGDDNGDFHLIGCAAGPWVLSSQEACFWPFFLLAPLSRKRRSKLRPGPKRQQAAAVHKAARPEAERKQWHFDDSLHNSSRPEDWIAQSLAEFNFWNQLALTECYPQPVPHRLGTRHQTFAAASALGWLSAFVER
jgi:hypothetical protein